MKKAMGSERFVPSQKYLPEEIIRKILLRLDVKSLRRFECVSKSWQTLIRQQSFINKHLKRQPSLVILFAADPGCLTVESIDNGVLLSSDFSTKRDWLWNPATYEFKALPPLPSIRRLYQITLVGLGYDSLANDFKVVRFYATGVDVFPMERKVLVYSLKRNSWRSILEMPPILSSPSSGPSHGAWNISNPCRSVVVNRSIHWTVSFREDDNAENELIIVVFDLSTEVFSRISGPRIAEFEYFRMDKLSECLSLVVTRVCGVPIFDVWVMKEYDVSDSWVKQVTVDLTKYPQDLPQPLHGIRDNYSEPLAFGNNGKLLILSGESLIWYDLESQKIKCIRQYSERSTWPVSMCGSIPRASFVLRTFMLLS